MQVLCVTLEDFTGSGIPLEPGEIEIGSEYTVIDVEHFNGLPHYHFAERPKFIYDVRNFAVLPDQSADQMQEENKEAIINIETPVL